MIRSLWTGWEQLKGNGLGRVDPLAYVLRTGMDDDAVNALAMTVISVSLGWVEAVSMW
ncbi:hypothetical protein DB41_BO00020 [Neochlamydia sp. TUME1]|nr:hypothetical protein DB41_BO00020 [Neochlamydia sp. TUME1]